MSIEYFRDELIGILKKRDFSKLAFRKLDNGYCFADCCLYANDKADDVEVFVTDHDNTISEETADRVIDALEHLDACIQRAYDWLSKQDLRDGWLTKPAYSPQELAQMFTLCELDFEENGSVLGSPKPDGRVLVMTFDLEDTEPFHGNSYPWHHDVYFDCDDLQPYKSEKDLW